MTEREHAPIAPSRSNLNGGEKRKRIRCKKKLSLLDSDSELKVIRNYFIMEQNRKRDLGAKRKKRK